MADPEEQLELGTSEEDGESKEPAAPTREEMDKLRADLQSGAEDRARLEGRLQAAEARVNQPPAASAEATPKTFTRTELQGMVDSGTITETEMQDRLEAQRDLSQRQWLTEELDKRDARNRVETTLQSDMQHYVENVEGILDEGSTNREKLRAEHAYLLKIGHEDNESTRLAACRAAFGPPQKIRETTVREPHQETGSPTPAGLGTSVEGWKKGLSRDQVAFQEKKLGMGYYAKGEKDPRFLSYNENARKTATGARVH